MSGWLSSAGAGEAAGFVAQEDGFDEGADGVFLVVVEAVEGFEVQGEVLVGAAVVLVEQERVCAGVQRECEVAQDVEGGLAGAGFVASDLGDVDAAAVGQGLLGQALLFACRGEAVGEV